MVGTNQLEWDHLGKLRTFASTEGRLSAGDKARGVVVCFWVESKVLGLVFEGNASSRASSAWHHPPVHRRAAYWREMENACAHAGDHQHHGFALQCLGFEPRDSAIL